MRELIVVLIFISQILFESGLGLSSVLIVCFFYADSNRLSFCLLSNSKNFPFVIQYAIYPSLKTGYLLRTDAAMLMLLLLLLASDGHFKNSPLNFNNIALVKALPDIKILSR